MEKATINGAMIAPYRAELETWNLIGKKIPSF